MARLRRSSSTGESGRGPFRTSSDVLNHYVATMPSHQNAIDSVPGWNGAMPPETGLIAGKSHLYADTRIHWLLSQVFSVCRQDGAGARTARRLPHLDPAQLRCGQHRCSRGQCHGVRPVPDHQGDPQARPGEFLPRRFQQMAGGDRQALPAHPGVRRAVSFARSDPPARTHRLQGGFGLSLDALFRRCRHAEGRSAPGPLLGEGRGAPAATGWTFGCTSAATTRLGAIPPSAAASRIAISGSIDPTSWSSC